MAISTTATDLNQAVRDKALPVLASFQRLSQSNSYTAETITEIQANITALIAAILAAGGTTGGATDQVTLTSGTKVNATAVSGSGNFATPTIVNGVITALVLSAS